MGQLVVYHDEGGGITQESLKFWQSIKQPGWRRFRITCHRYSQCFNTEVTCWDFDNNYIIILLSGFSVGYGGEGPNGLVKLLADCGFPPNLTKNAVFTEDAIEFG